MKEVPSIAYFSMEIGLASDIPTYSGGLGVLAGDILYKAVDLEIPMVAVTLCYAAGYFYQMIGPYGDQISKNIRWQFSSNFDKLPIVIPIKIQGKEFKIGTWVYNIIGKRNGFVIPVFLLDSETNSIYSRGTYPVIAYVGDEHHEATPQDIDAVLKNLVNLQHNRYMAFQHWVKVQPLEVKQSDIVETTLEYLRLNEAASLGMPLAFATGSGENTNKATLYTQSRFLEFTLNDIVKRTLSTLRKYMFKRISFYNKVRGNAWIKWGDIGAEEINDKGTTIKDKIRVAIDFSTIGAKTSAAKNPRTTDGTEAIISIEVLTVFPILLSINSEVYKALKTAIGTANSSE